MPFTIGYLRALLARISSGGGGGGHLFPTGVWNDALAWDDSKVWNDA